MSLDDILILSNEHPAHINSASQMQQQDLVVRACGMGDLSAVRNYISKGADINSPGSPSLPLTPLYAASQGYKASGPDGHLELVQLLIAAGANPNTPVAGGSTPLHLAAELGLTKVAQSLLAAGAHTEVFKADGSTPLHMACMHGHQELVDLLLRAGAGVDTAHRQSGASPLYLACQQGHSAVVRLLMAAGANKEAGTRFGHTPLLIAIIMDRLDIIQLLLQAGANMELTLRDQPNSYQNGMTPLIMGAECKREAACIMLLAAGADPSKRTDEGKSAFDYLPSLERWRPAADGTRPVVLGPAAPGPPPDSGYSRDQLMSKSIRELKALLVAHGCSLTGLLYKAELVDRLLQE